MTWLIVLAALWVIAATLTALMPMRYQYVPGIALLALAPVLIVKLGIEFGWIMGLLAALAFVSMFRNPLKYYYARLWGQKPDLPK